MNCPIRLKSPAAGCLVGLAAACCFPCSAFADLIPDGYKHIRSEVIIEGMEQFPELDFALFPMGFRNEDGGMEVKSGESVDFYRMLSPQLFALRAGTDITKASAFADPSIPRSETKIRQVGLAPETETARLIRRVYRITGIDGSQVALEQQPDAYYEADGKLREQPVAAQKPLPTALATAPKDYKMLALAGGAGLFALMAGIFQRYRRRAEVGTGTDPAA